MRPSQPSHRLPEAKVLERGTHLRIPSHRQELDLGMYLESVITNFRRGTVRVVKRVQNRWKADHPEAVNILEASGLFLSFEMIGDALKVDSSHDVLRCERLLGEQRLVRLI